MKRTLALLLVSVLLAGQAWAQETKIVRDNLGRKHLVDVKTLQTPGAGGELGTIEAAIIDDTNPLAWDGHMFDVAIGLSAVGVAGDDSAATESAITALGVYWIPNTESGWFAIGPRASWSLSNTEEVTFEIPARITLWPDPYSAYRWNLHFSAFSYTIRTGAGDVPRESAWSFAPSLSVGWEIPRGAYSIEFAAGATYPFSIQGVTDADVNSAVDEAQLRGQVTVYWRQR